MAKMLSSVGKWLPVVILALVVALGSTALQQDSEGRWLRVEERDLVISIPIEGELKAVSSDILGPPVLKDLHIWNFKVSYMAPEGKEVRQGQPVIRFDTTDVQRQLMQKMTESASAAKELEKSITDFKIERRDLQLQLAEAEAALRKAKLTTAVSEEIVAVNELRVARIDQRMAEMQIQHLKGNLEYLGVKEKAQLDNLRRRQSKAEAEVTQLQAAVGAMTVKAPRDGTVIYYAEEGREKVKTSDTVWRGRHVLEIPDLTQMQIDAEVAEADAGQLKEGQTVTFRLDTHPDHEYRGRVEQIHRAVQTKSATNPRKVMRAVVSVAETDTERMRPGMRLRGTVEIERLPAKVVVPQEAVISDASGAWVTTRSWWRRQRLQPRLGRRSDQWFEVLEGLQPGDSVLAQDQLEAP